MILTPLSIFLENKPGRLQHILQVLADNTINIQTLTIAEVNDFGILRLLVDKPEEAFTALRKEQITCSKTDVLAVVIEDQWVGKRVTAGRCALQHARLSRHDLSR